MKYVMMVVGLLCGAAGMMEVTKITLGAALIVTGAIGFCLGLVAVYIDESAQKTRDAAEDAMKALAAAMAELSAEQKRTNELLSWIGDLQTQALTEMSGREPKI